MIRSYNRIGFVLGTPGFFLAHAGWIYAMLNRSLVVAWTAIIVGVALLVCGLAYAAAAKGRSPLWGATGLVLLLGLPFAYFVGWIPLVLLACLGDESHGMEPE